MALFQKNVLARYIAAMDAQPIDAAYQQFVAYFHDVERQQNILTSKEEQFQEGFLRELFVKILGYTLNPDPAYNLITEKKDENDSKKADGAILLNDEVIGIIELKDHKTPDLNKVEHQAFGYKNQHPKAKYVIISNFQKLRFYIDNAVEYVEWNLFTLTREEFAELWLCLQYDNLSHHLPATVKSESLSREEQITNKLYKDYIAFKRALFENILLRNTTEEGEHSTAEWKILLFKKTQKLLDRLLFIFFAEDRDLLPPNSMREIIKQWRQLIELDEYSPLYSRIKKYFGYMNEGHKGKKYDIFAYNGGLFKPDEVLDNLDIDDELLAEHTLRLSEYDFASEVDVNILGHIFENSLNEIEEVTAQLQNGEAPTVSKRKKDGVFYTPQYITRYIVNNTLGKLCREKREAMGLVEEDYYDAQNRQLKTKQRMMDQLTEYRNWLLSLTICDPACGSGAFLNAALQFLINEHRSLDKMEAALTGSAIEFPNVENSILENNLYGVDINEESVEIARLALWLRTAKPFRKLTTLNGNIKCGNSLISDPAIAGDKAFDWQKEFPQVFKKGGFDVVIGNPPYVDSETMTKTIPLERDWISKNYTCAKGNWDLLVPFIEKGYSLLRSGGIQSFITSNKWLALDYGTAIRNEVASHISVLIDCTNEKVFDSANVSSVIFVLEENISTKIKVGTAYQGEITHYNTIAIDNEIKLLLIENLSLAFSNSAVLIKKMKKKPRLQDNPSYNVFGSFTTAEAYLLVPYVSENIHPTTQEFKLINTGTIDKYKSLWGYSKIKYLGTEHLYPIVNKQEFKNNFGKRFEKLNLPKIIITGIRYFEAFYDEFNEYLPAKSTVTITSQNINLKRLVTILNSRAISIYIHENYYSSSMGGGINFTPDVIKSLPVPDLSNAVDLETFADQMLALNKDLQEKRARFLRRVEENLGVKITGALETFDMLTFKDFCKELSKQKCKLTLSQQDEWEEYFNLYATDCQALTQTIQTTDSQIDELVYDLYGLTEPEKEIIRKS